MGLFNFNYIFLHPHLDQSNHNALNRKKAEEQMRGSGDFFRAVIENALDGVALIEADGNLRYTSPSVKAILGYEPRDIENTSAFDLVRPEDLPRVRGLFEKLLASPGLVLRDEFQGKHRDGTWRSLQAAAKSHSFTNPDFLGVVLNYQDVTEIKKAEKASSRLASIVESSNDAIYSLTLRGVVTSWNPGAERIYGYPPEEIGGRDISLVVPPAREAEFPMLLETVRHGKPVSNFNTVHWTKNGASIIVSLTVSPILNDLGQVTMASVIARDSTETQKASAVREILQDERDQLLEKLQLQMESMPMACFILDKNFKITYCNPATEKMFGYVLMELEGKSVFTLLTDRDRTGAEEYADKIKAGLVPPPSSIREAKHKNGRVLICECFNRLLHDKGGNWTGMMTMALDITERQKAQEVQTQLASILSQTNDAVIACDLDGRVYSWNRGAERMFGYTLDEIFGQPISCLTLEERHADQKKDLGKVFEGVSLANIEVVVVRKDRTTLDVSISLSPILDSKGRILGASAILRDITERRKSEEAQRRLASILEQTPDAVIVADVNGFFVDWNKGAERIYGYSAAEMLGTTGSVLEPEELKGEIATYQKRVLGGEEPLQYQTKRRRKNGDLIEVEVTFSGLKNSFGQLIGYSYFVRDVTERQKAEEILRQHEEQMRRVDKMNAIGRLAGGVAHDFNNLLSVIGGNAEFLISGLPADDPKCEELREIQTAVRRGAELTKQLLVFGQKQVVQPQPVNLNNLSVEMNKMLKRLVDASLDLSIIQQKDLKDILADPGQMQQIILNLVLNARDAMPEGGSLIIETRNVEASRLEAEQRATLPPGDFVRLNVTDTGTGMSPEIQKHIFEPFFTTKAGKGTGLGLATVYSIVAKWSGHIFLHSTPGMGTTFSLYFPALQALKPTPAQPPKQIDLIPLGSETILLAEDEEPVRKVLVRTLEKYGYRVLAARNGIEAVQQAWIYKEPIHLLLTDTVMPKMNGKELAEEIRKSRPNTKILFVSGYPREVLSQQGVLGSDIHLVQKPFELEDLARQIRKILDEK